MPFGLDRAKRIASNGATLNRDALCKFIFEADYFKEKMVQIQQDQLQAGLGSDGNSLPRYVDDPYFSSMAQALHYQEWKAKISPNSGKPEEVMDFFINGFFQSQLVALPYPDRVVISSTDPLDIGESAQAKTDNKALGLNDDSKAELLPEAQKSFLLLSKDKLFAK